MSGGSVWEHSGPSKRLKKRIGAFGLVWEQLRVVYRIWEHLGDFNSIYIFHLIDGF